MGIIRSIHRSEISESFMTITDMISMPPPLDSPDMTPTTTPSVTEQTIAFHVPVSLTMISYFMSSMNFVRVILRDELNHTLPGRHMD
jgi:hypothetical protein